MMRRVTQVILERHREVVALVAVVTLLFAVFLPNVAFQTDVEAFLPDSEVVEQHHAVETLFGRESHVAYVYLTLAEGQNNTLTLPALQESLLLAQQALNVEHVTNVISVASYFDSALRDETGTGLNEYSNETEFWEMVYDIVYASASSSNYTADDINFLLDVLVRKGYDLVPFLLPGDNPRSAPVASATLIIVQLDPALTPEGRKQVGVNLREEVNAQRPQLKVVEAKTFSVDLLAHDVDESTSRTNLLMGLGMLAFTVALLWLAFRHWSYVVLPVATLILAVLWTFGFAGMVGIPLTAIDVAVMPLIVGLGIDFAVHMSRRYQEELLNKHKVHEALLEAQTHTGHALALAAVTTVIAFLSGVTASVGPVKDFSLLCATGITFAFILTLTFHTAMRYWLDTTRGPAALRTDTGSAEMLERVILRTARTVERKPIAILAVVTLVTITALFGAVRIETAFELDDFLSDDLEIMLTARSVQEQFKGASYSQSQIIIQGDIIQREVLSNISDVQKKMENDLFVINLGAEARVDSIYEVVRAAIDAERYAMYHGNTINNETLNSILFDVRSGEQLDITWHTTQNPAVLTLEAQLVWHDINGTSLGATTLNYLPSPQFNYAADTTVPDKAVAARLRFTHLNDSDDEPLVTQATVHDGQYYLYAQSVQDTFHLDYRGYQISATTTDDIQALFDYLYHRQDVADRFTGESYADKTRWVLHRNTEGEYDAMLIRVFIGPKPGYPLDNNGLNQMLDELEKDIPADAFPGTSTHFTGGHVLTITTVNAIQEAQLSSTVLATIMAALLLIIIYRHVGYGLLTILPVLLATTWILATMYLLGITLNVLTVMVTALTVGLGIDYAIHIIERYREERIKRSEEEAIEATVLHTGSALLISSVTTVCGFGVLILSPMPLVRNFGIITAATIVYSVFIAVLVLPSLLRAGWHAGHWWDKRQRKRQRKA